MRVANVKTCDIANGPGVRTSVFTSGCRLHCPGCFNEVAQDFSYGREYDDDLELEILDSLAMPYVRGLTVLGGEPLEPESLPGVLRLVSVTRDTFGDDRDVWLFTGHRVASLSPDGCTVEGVAASPELDALMGMVNVVVDGPFVRGLHDPLLRFRGSSNQRLIDVGRSVGEGSVVGWSDGAVLGTRGAW